CSGSQACGRHAPEDASSAWALWRCRQGRAHGAGQQEPRDRSHPARDAEVRTRRGPANGRGPQQRPPGVCTLDPVKLLLTGTAGPRGWPEAGCPCASCATAAGETVRAPFGVTVDGTVTFPWTGTPGYTIDAN